MSNVITDDEGDIAVLLDFLERRGCEDSIEKIKEEKVDCETLLSLSEEELTIFIPKLGDRYATKRFCRRYVEEKEKDLRKQSLFEKFKKKMSKRRNEDAETADTSSGKVKDTRKLKLKGNRNASREQRKIVIGWMNYNSETNNFHQVREKHGGGSREVKVDKKWKSDDILKLGKSLFFPNGISQIGKQEEFDFTLKDFQQSDINSDTTVAEMYNETHIKLLKFYVFTTPKEVLISDSDSSLPEINLSKPSFCKQSGISSADCPVEPTQQHGAEEKNSNVGSQFAPILEVPFSVSTDEAQSSSGSHFQPVQVVIPTLDASLGDYPIGIQHQYVHVPVDMVEANITTCSAKEETPSESQYQYLLDDIIEVTDTDSFPTASCMHSHNIQSEETVTTDSSSSSFVAGSQGTGNQNVNHSVQSEGTVTTDSSSSSLVAGFHSENQNVNHTVQSEEAATSNSDSSLANSHTGSQYLQYVQVDDEILFSMGSMSNLQAPESTTTEVPVVKVHQGNCFAEILHLFQQSEMTLKESSVRRILPNGEEEKAEGVGLIRDILTEFWSTFYLKCCEGSDIKVPILRHDMGQSEWEAVARVICDGYETVEYFPVKIAKSVIEDACSGVLQNDYTQEFLKFIPLSERKTLEIALKNFQDADLDELLDILDCHGCKKIATAETLVAIVREIAHKEIIQEPKFITECWRNIFREKLQIDTISLSQIYDAKVPTVKKVLKLLIFPTTLLPKEQSSCDFLRRFVKGLDEKGLQNFLRFCTGSDLIGENITVEFTSLSGFERRPTAQTCGSILRIPATYESYADMKEEFYNILTSNVWEMGYV